MQTAPREEPLASLLSFQRRRSDALREGGFADMAAFARNGVQRIGRIWTRIALATAAVLLVAVVGLTAFRSSYSGRVYPAVTVAGVPIGGDTQVEARAAVEARVSAMEQGFISFSYAGQTWNPTLTQVGATIDIDGALARAYNVGREDGAWDRLSAVTGLMQEDQTIPFNITLDYATLDRWFDQVDKDLGLVPHDAYLVIDGRDVSIEPEVDGTIVDRGSAYRQIQAALSTLTPMQGALPVVVWNAKVRAGDLEAAQKQVDKALSHNIKISFQNQEFTVRAEDLAQFITQAVSDDPSVIGAAAFSVGIDEKALAAWLNAKYAAKVNKDPVDATVGWNEGLVALTASEDGYTLKSRSLARAVGQSLFGDHSPVEIPVSVIKPDVDSNNLGALGITTQIGRGDSNYSGSNEARQINIATGSSLLNGTLVPPHEEFDFNHAIGEITTDKGYVEAKVIAGERIDRDIGGGICQVSTTIFRAALLAGLPITEWNPHLYRIANYEYDGWDAGFDASILQPEGDPFQPGNSFKFLNPTDSWLLVQAVSDGVHVVVTIYGPDLGYQVEVSDSVAGNVIPPDSPLEVVKDDLPAGTMEQTELPEWGQVFIFNRTVYDRDGNVVESRDFQTIFHSHGVVWEVSSDMAGQSPASTGVGVTPDPPPPTESQ